MIADWDCAICGVGLEIQRNRRGRIRWTLILMSWELMKIDPMLFYTLPKFLLPSRLPVRQKHTDPQAC